MEHNYEEKEIISEVKENFEIDDETIEKVLNDKKYQVAPYIDLSGLGVGEHEVEIKINNTNPLVTYVVSSKVKIKISET